VKAGLEIITEDLLHFVRGCIQHGIDGFYASTQGGESQRFQDPSIFAKYIKPFDLAIWEAITPHCPFNILHVCDYRYGYADYSPFINYPGQVVNCSLKLGERELTGQEIARLFGRPFMGGMERLGVLACGAPEEVRRAARSALEAHWPAILAADCTVPAETPWDNLKAAIDAAHG
jgi:uroporphyrinogen decarboxylase